MKKILVLLVILSLTGCLFPDLKTPESELAFKISDVSKIYYKGKDVYIDGYLENSSDYKVNRINKIYVNIGLEYRDENTGKTDYYHSEWLIEDDDELETFDKGYSKMVKKKLSDIKINGREFVYIRLKKNTGIDLSKFNEKNINTETDYY